MITLAAPEAAERLLRAQLVGRIGCHVLGRTHVALVPYLYEQGAILLCVEPGLELRMMRLNPSVCFEVDDTDTLPWASLAVSAEFRELAGAEAEDARARLFAELGRRVEERHGADSARDHAPRWARGVVARLEIVQRRGSSVRPAGAPARHASAA
ncbi:MAG: pyridoxamine 5'-phosphate oxidase family protein [Polyangiaceae bacterium]|nr:pyridoxamine 5'-phosphate oxidase family protein [Polyangiaceae bacterium]